MNMKEALELMISGNKLTHEYFAEQEWATMTDPMTVKFEDGCEMPLSVFLIDRTDSAWDEGWKIWHISIL